MYEFLEYQARHVMTRGPKTIEPSASLAQAEAIFEKHDFNALPVVEPAGRPVGIFSKLDFLGSFAFKPTSMIPRYDEVMRSPVGEHMSRELVTVTPDSPLTRVLQELVRTRNKSLPVVDGTHLVGIVAREDVLRALRRAAGGKRPGDDLGVES